MLFLILIHPTIYFQKYLKKVNTLYSSFIIKNNYDVHFWKSIESEKFNGGYFLSTPSACSKIIQKSKPKTSNFYIQVNIGNEAQKSGVKPQDLKKLYEYSLEKNLKVVGLMCIPPVDKDPTLYFKDMVSLRDITNPNLLLSMGMSADYLPALQNGSNLIRVGSKIFQ